MDEKDVAGRAFRTDAPTASIPAWGATDAALSEESLTPGMQLGGRYRIVARLGRGGMGVVYHADDLTLGEPVALKFLSGVRAERSRVQSLVDEVRIGRRIAHPNVCRVHDLVEIGTRHFISMELVEGEDLSHLVRHAGRLPSRRGLALARDVCMGVAALHEAGIIHRDLKPANVLVDRRGRARVSDFGLATSLQRRSAGGSSLSGTLSYMAPEQFSGAEAGVATDIYSLGLVLWELFAGEPALEPSTFEGIVAFHAAGSRVRALASVVPDIPDAIDGIVARCLDADPARRPASAGEVLRALPGGDPLDAALEEGETPTPEMVAAASMKGDLSRGAVALLVAVIVAGFALGVQVFEKSRKGPLLRALQAPSEMEARARSLLDGLGIAHGRDQAGGYAPNEAMIAHLGRGEGAERWEPLFEPGSPYRLYWYRTGPDLDAWSPGRVSFDDPPFVVAGMSGVVLDPSGRLVRLRHVPDNKEGDASAMTAWEELFAEAGLDPVAFEEIDPPVAPAVGADEVRAWRGLSPRLRETELVVVGGWLAGLPVWFEVLHPWDLEVARGGSTSLAPEAVAWGFGAVLALIAGGAVVAARRNLRRGRSDARGAWNLSLFLFAAWAASWVVATRFRSVLDGLAYGALIAVCSWFAYVAVEPEVRRRWPRVLIGWTRLVHGRAGDARVGREILLGMLLAVVTKILTTLASSAMSYLEMPAPDPTTISLRGTAVAEAGEIFFDLVIATVIALALLTALALMARVIRNPNVGIAILCVAIVVVFAPAGAGAFSILLAVPLLVLVRQGLLCSVTVYFTMFLGSDLLGMNLGAWYAPQVATAAAALAALAAWSALAAVRNHARA